MNKIEEAVETLKAITLLLQSPGVAAVLEDVKKRVQQVTGAQTPPEIAEVLTPGMHPDRLCIRLVCQTVPFETLLDQDEIEITKYSAEVYIRSRLEEPPIAVEVSCRLTSGSVPEDYLSTLRMIGKLRWISPEPSPYEALLCDSPDDIPF